MEEILLKELHSITNRTLKKNKNIEKKSVRNLIPT